MVTRGINWFTNLYPVWTIIVAVIALIRPEILTWFTGPFVSVYHVSGFAMGYWVRTILLRS